MICPEIQAHLGHTFKNEDLLLAALTHRSFYFENRETCAQDNERLEFLGDAVLGLVISDHLMHAFAASEEGELTKWRASLVNENTLAEMAREWGLQKYLRLGKSEDAQRDRLSARVLSSSLEALFGAVYWDAGFEKARERVSAAFAHRLENLDLTLYYAADFKTRLQEYCQKAFKTTPTYELVGTEGPAHARRFETKVCFGRTESAVGHGSSRRLSEQEAARLALALVEAKLQTPTLPDIQGDNL